MSVFTVPRSIARSVLSELKRPRLRGLPLVVVVGADSGSGTAAVVDDSDMIRGKKSRVFKAENRRTNFHHTADGKSAQTSAYFGRSCKQKSLVDPMIRSGIFGDRRNRFVQSPTGFVPALGNLFFSCG